MNKFQKLLWPLWRSRRKKIQIKGKKKRKRTSKERESEDSSYSYNKYKNNISKGLRSSVYDINLWSALSLESFVSPFRSDLKAYPCVNQLATWWWWIKCDPALVDKHHPHSNVSRAKSIIYTTTSIS